MDQLVSVFGQVQAWHWLAFGLALLVAELSTGTTYLLWPAVAAWLTGLMMLFFPLGFPAQLTIFAIVTLTTSLTGRQYLRGRWLQSGDATLNDAASQLIGQVGAVAQPIEQGIGQIRLGDTVWRAASEDELGLGEAVEVIGVEGATLKVRRRAPAPQQT
jgi:membrane protein implicated in regulation of membrane protease activity